MKTFNHNPIQKIHRSIHTLLCALLLGAGIHMPLLAAPVDVTISAWVPPTHSLVADFIVPWMAEVEKATEGRVKPRLVPKPVTNAAGHYDAVRNGLVDVTFISHAYYPGRFELTKLGILPLAGSHGRTRSIAAWRIYDKYLKGANEHRGVKLLGMYGHGPGMVMTASKPILKVEDFRGLKMRIAGGMAADVGRALGVNGVAKPAPESYELMSTGVVDGTFFPAESLIAFKLEEVVRYITRFPGGLYGDTHGFIMNERTWQKLEPRDQEALERLSGEHIARMAGAAWGDTDDRALALAKARGIQIIDADERFVANVRALTAQFEQNWLAAAKKHGIDGAAVIAEWRQTLQALDEQWLAGKPLE